MILKWKNYDYEPGKRRTALTALFQAGISRGLNSDRLTELAGHLINASNHDSTFGLRITKELVEHAPQTASAWLAQGHALRKDGQIAAAIAATEKALVLHPGRTDALVLLGKLHFENGDWTAAEKLYRQAFEKDQAYAAVPLCETLIRTGKIEIADSLLSDVSSRFGHTTASKALMCVVHHLRGNQEALAILQQRDLLVSTNAEVGAALTIDELNALIVKKLRDSPVLVHEPGSTATKHGQQAAINDLLPEELCRSVLEIIENAVTGYVQKLGQSEFVASMPDRLGIESWAVTLDDGGYQHAHIHPNGWLSGVYYVDVPSTDTGSDAGAIEFWKPPRFLVGDAEPETVIIKPSSGLLLLFPSYFYHHTIPHRSVKKRISIAFDIQAA